MLRLIVLTLACIAAPLTAAQVQVTLTDGQVIEGELIKEDDAGVTVQQRIAGRSSGMSATITYARNRVAKVEPVPDAATRYAEMAAKAPDTVPAQLGLASWCRDHDLRDQAIARAQHVLEMEPGNARAVELLNGLGLWQLDGAWLSEADYCAKTGKVRYQDRLVTPAEAEQLRAQAAAGAEAKTAQVAAEQADARRARLVSDIASLDKQMQALEEAKTKAAKAESQAAATQERFTALERDLAATKAKADAEKKAGKISQGTQNELDNAQARLDKERTAQRESKRAQETAATKTASLDKQMAALREKRTTMEQQLAKADAEAAEKKKAAEQAAAAVPAKP